MARMEGDRIMLSRLIVFKTVFESYKVKGSVFIEVLLRNKMPFFLLGNRSDSKLTK